MIDRWKREEERLEGGNSCFNSIKPNLGRRKRDEFENAPPFGIRRILVPRRGDEATFLAPGQGGLSGEDNRIQLSLIDCKSNRG